jgi:DNA-binding NtrC family response regulator
VPRSGAIQLEDIERFSPELQSYWCEQVAKAESDGFRDGPRIFASSSSPAVRANAEGEICRELRSMLQRFSLDLPPLRAIPDDIPAIADSMVQRIGRDVGRRVRLSRSARAHLATGDWPGNHRQLSRVLERALVFTRGRQIRRDVVQEVMAELEHSVSSIRERRRAQERRAVMRAIEETGGNISQTAHRLGRSRSAIYRLIEKYGLHRS